MFETFQYVGYLKRKNGYNIVLLEEVKSNGDGLIPVLERGQYGNQLLYVSEERFNKLFSSIPVGSMVNVTFNRYGNVASVE